MKERKGYLFQSEGKWFARITFTDEEGKRRNIKRTATTKAEAKGLLKILNRKIDDDGIKTVQNWKTTFEHLADYYMETYAKPAKFIENQKVEGMRDIKRVRGFLVHFRAYFGSKKLSDITYDSIFQYRAIRLKVLTPKGTTRTMASMNRELAYLRRIFNIAVRQGWINKNPINCGESLIKIFAERKRERILTVEEEARLLRACEHPRRKHLKPLLIALLDTGARKGEMLKLKWKDIDFESRLITIQALNTKTLKKRRIATTKRLVDEFTKLWKESDGNLNSLVFGITDNVRKSFSSACKIAGIKEGGIDGLTLHCLRHSAATRLIKGQLPIQMVGRILGHQNPVTTYRYLTANEETLYQAASILESLQQNNDSKIESELIN